MKIIIKKVLKGERGFTLIELMIVVMIIAILSSFAIPTFLNFRSKAMQSEAKVLLSSLFASETVYFSFNSRYSMDDSMKDSISMSEPKFYRNWDIIVYDDDTRFIATCSTNLDNDAFLDVWRVSDISREPKYNWDDVRNIGPEPD